MQQGVDRGRSGLSEAWRVVSMFPVREEIRSSKSNSQMPKLRAHFHYQRHRFRQRYSYRISSDAEEEFKRTFLVMKPIGATLEDFQYKVEMPGQIAGRSGALHRFDAVASKGSSEIIVLDVVASDREIEETPIASLYAKVFDVSPSQTILVAIPGLTEKAKRLAALYRIFVIQASDSQQAAELLKGHFGWAGLSGNEESIDDLQL